MLGTTYESCSHCRRWQPTIINNDCTLVDCLEHAGQADSATININSRRAGCWLELGLAG